MDGVFVLPRVWTGEKWGNAEKFTTFRGLKTQLKLVFISSHRKGRLSWLPWELIVATCTQAPLPHPPQPLSQDLPSFIPLGGSFSTAASGRTKHVTRSGNHISPLKVHCFLACLLLGLSDQGKQLRVFYLQPAPMSC